MLDVIHLGGEQRKGRRGVEGDVVMLEGKKERGEA